MELEPVEKTTKEKNKIFHITVRFNKAQYKALSDAFWKSGKYMGVIARTATLEYLRTHFGVNVPDD